MNSALHSVTSTFVSNFVDKGGDREDALDPTTFFAFAELILELIGKIKECREGTPQDVRTPKFGQRLKLRKHLIEQMGRKDFRAKGDKVIEALYKTGEEVNDDDLAQLWKEAD
jgi:hypothetical protein